MMVVVWVCTQGHTKYINRQKVGSAVCRVNTRTDCCMICATAVIVPGTCRGGYIYSSSSSSIYLVECLLPSVPPVSGVFLPTLVLFGRTHTFSHLHVYAECPPPSVQTRFAFLSGLLYTLYVPMCSTSSGRIPAELGQLSRLTHLNLSNCRLIGELCSKFFLFVVWQLHTHFFCAA